MSLFGELKRRNVFRVAAAYLAVAWLVVQIVETLFPVFGLGDAAIRRREPSLRRNEVGPAGQDLCGKARGRWRRNRRESLGQGEAP